jgi:tetratricopeptide (TPR) repeat protein
MPKAVVTEEEIEVAEKLRGQGEFATALALTQDMLSRVQDGDAKMRLLFDVLYCSTRLGADDLTSNAIHALEQMPQPEMSRIFIDWIQAVSYISFGREQEALDLLEANLKTEFMEREDFVIWKYKHLAYKGQALAFLQKWEDALTSSEEAHKICQGGQMEADILINKSLCLKALGRYEEAYATASQVQKWNSVEMATLAMQYMAECRLWQGRIPEAGKLYMEIQKRLPCRLVDEKRIKEGMSQCIASLGKSS